MSTSPRCAICMKPDLRRLIELGWNAKMSAPQIAAVFGGIPSSSVILKHLHDHVEEGAYNRTIPVVNARPLRERALAIQQVQIEEFERRMTVAQERAAAMNAEHEGEPNYVPIDWSHFFDVLGKDMQAAVSSILKMVGLEDKKAAVKTGAAVDVFKMMLGGGDGLAPKRLVQVIEGDAEEVGDADDGPAT